MEARDSDYTEVIQNNKLHLGEVEITLKSETEFTICRLQNPQLLQFATSKKTSMQKKNEKTSLIDNSAHTDKLSMVSKGPAAKGWYDKS